MLKNSQLIPLLTAALLMGSAHAADYTWTGAVDGDWANAANWDANGVPVDTDPATTALDQQTQNDNIIINGSVAPSLNIPQFAGGNAFDRSKENTPEIQMLLGTMTVSAGTWGNQGQVHNGSWSSSVGDGDAGNGLAELNYNIIQGAGSGLNRDDNSLMSWTVNADGTLNIDYTAGSTLKFAYSSTRTISFNLAGGTVNIANALDLDGHAGNFFDLTVSGASVTADFGGDFADLAAVNAAIGIHFISTTAETLSAIDNTDGTFTVTTVNDSDPPTPDPMTFAVAPASLNGTTVGMTATTATDLLSPTIEYFFENVTAATDSGWISDATWNSTGLTAGVSYDFRVKARDAAGNETQWSAVASATPVVDITAPTVGSLSPSNGAASILPDADLVLTFSEDVVAASGFITLKNLTDATQVQIDVTDGSQVSVAGSVLTINPTADLELGKQYAVQIDAGAFEDLAGTPNVFAGIADDSTWSFTVRSFPDGTYVWTGAVDGDWNNSGNWDAGLIPVDSEPGDADLDLDTTTGRIGFNAVGSPNPVPTTNIPDLGGNPFSGPADTPVIDVLNGTIAFSLVEFNGGSWVHSGSVAMTVGDGDTANGGASVTYSHGNATMNRDNDSPISWTVNADGALNFTTGGSVHDLAYGVNRTINFQLDGGTVTFAKALQLDGFAGNYFEFTANGGEVTAAFGGDFADLAAVQAQIGSGLVFRPAAGLNLSATDNLDGTFTVGFTVGAITSFEAAGVTGVIDQTANTIALEVPFGTDLATLAPTFTLSSGSCDQTSGLLPAPTFAAQNPVDYTVTDTSTDPDTVNVYSVTVTVAPETATIVIDLGAGTEIKGGESIDAGPANLPLPAVPGGSILKSIDVNVTLSATDNDNFASDLALLFEPAPGGSFSVGISRWLASKEFTPATEIEWAPATGEGGAGTALVDTITESEWIASGPIDLSSTGLSLGNNFDQDDQEALQGGTWTGTITLTYEVGSGLSDYDAWAAGFAPADLTDPDADLDGDGLTNDEERAFGLNPTDPSSVDPFTVPVDANGDFSYQRRDPALSGLGYSIWASTDLQTWTEDTGAVQTPGAVVGETQEVAVTTSVAPVDGKLFVEVRAD